ncbi:MAG: hypothetical protein JNM68_13435 [Dinghuibacter sp.]|nr:hypothetical protein [Dinghuibacter sp.]
MFGLLKQQPASCAEHTGDFSRKHYCGVCKTIGSRYGQTARLTLNSDIVFMAELLTALNDAPMQHWQASLSSYNCFRGPGKQDELPRALEYAAAVNMLMTVLKIKDNITDSRNPLWTLAGRIFKSPYRKASACLNNWQVPVQQVENCVTELQRREQCGLKKGVTPGYYARPVGLLTGIVLSHGAVNKTHRAELFRTGYYFGEMVYLFDALRDRVQDARKKRFNPLLVIQPAVPVAEVEQELNTLHRKMAASIGALPLTEQQTAYFVSKLQLNFHAALQPENQIAHSCKQKAEKLTMALRWEKARAVFFQLKQVQQPGTHFLRVAVQKQLVPALAFLAVFINPATALAASRQQQGGTAGDWLWIAALGAAGWVTRDKCCKDPKCKCCSEPCCKKQ